MVSPREVQWLPYFPCISMPGGVPSFEGASARLRPLLFHQILVIASYHSACPSLCFHPFRFITLCGLPASFARTRAHRVVSYCRSSVCCVDHGCNASAAACIFRCLRFIAIHKGEKFILCFLRRLCPGILGKTPFCLCRARFL